MLRQPMNNRKQRAPLFILTIDTEEEWNWDGPLPAAPFTTDHVLDEIPRFQDFCCRHEIIPTYFVDYTVAEDSRNSDLLKSYLAQSSCDIGAHLHPWCTPPLKEDTSDHNSYMINLPLELVIEKLDNLTRLLEIQFGTHPFSFRSGRWGMTGPILRHLVHLGYKVDSSIRPLYDEPPLNYGAVMPAPYWPDLDDVVQKGRQREILEIPVSAGYTRRGLAFWNSCHQLLSRPALRNFRIIGALWHLQIMRKIALTPEDFQAEDIIRCIDASVKSGCGIIQMFLHSPDLAPGKTPYVRDTEDLERFYAKLGTVFTHLATVHNVHSCSMRDAFSLLTEPEERA